MPGLGQRVFQFTTDHEDYLRQNYPLKVSLKEAAAHLGAPESAVERHVARLGSQKCPVALRNERSGRSRKQWTQSRIKRRVEALVATGHGNSGYVQEHEKALFSAANKEFGSWRAAVESCGISYDDVNLHATRRSWTHDDILAEIGKLKAAGESLQAADVRDRHGGLFNAVRREPSLGTWAKAVKAAGLDYAKIRGERYGSYYEGKDGRVYASRLEGLVGERLDALRKDGLIQDIKYQVRVAEGRGWRCDFVAVLHDGTPLWIEVDGMGDGRAEGGYGADHPKIQHYRRSNRQWVVVRRADQAEKAVRGEERGRLTRPSDSPRKITELGECRYTDEDILAEVQRVVNELGRAPTTSEYADRASITIQTVRRRVGWAQALATAGVVPHRNVPKRSLIEEVQRVATCLGRAPSRAEFDEAAAVSAQMVAKAFRSWNDGIRAAGLEPVHDAPVWTEQRVLKRIQQLHGRIPRLGASHMQTAGESPTYYAAQRIFGSWRAALEAAGLDYREAVAGWSRNYDECVECGTREYVHASNGRCKRCYEAAVRSAKKQNTRSKEPG